MLYRLLLVCLPVAFAQIPVYLRTPAIAVAAAPIAQLQCAQQCMPSCLPSCLVAQSPYPAYQPVVKAVQATPVVQTPPDAASFYQPYSAGLAYYPVVPSCTPTCMPTCAPTCVSSSPSPQRDDLPTPPPETVPTPSPEITTTAPTDVVPCKCLIKITITQGNNTISKCGPNSCACPQGYNQCGSNCCRA
ncbi:unnamed protein product [Caenorhabditis sp. 36 PRJEB53466]|nr:unnamed protein product [Caenorhabditis sp. 36 PRJEB53466]